MKKLILTPILALFLIGCLSAQIGIFASISNPRANKWDALIEQNGGEFLKSSYNVGINHSIPIPNFGMRILPELNYATYEAEWNDTNNTSSTPINLELSVFTFLINSNIYLFNLEGDCDCPTWGKDGNFFEKGFHLEVGPGLSYFKHVGERGNPDSGDELSNTNVRLVVNVGLGLDIGLTKKITVTPFARMRWNSPSEWENLESIVNDLTKPEVEEVSSDFIQREIGIKIGYRYKN